MSSFSPLNKFSQSGACWSSFWEWVSQPLMPPPECPMVTQRLSPSERIDAHGSLAPEVGRGSKVHDVAVVLGSARLRASSYALASPVVQSLGCRQHSGLRTSGEVAVNDAQRGRDQWDASHRLARGCLH